MAQQDTLVYVELSVALPGLLPTLYLASSGTPHGTERLSEQDEECLKVGLFATAPIGFIVANDHQRSTVRLLKIKCFSTSLSSPSLEEGRHKKQWCSIYTSCWFLNEGVLAAHSGSFWLPFTPTMVKKELYHADVVQEACSQRLPYSMYHQRITIVCYFMRSSEMNIYFCRHIWNQKQDRENS